MTQVKFYDHDNQITHGGILLDGGDLLCACCEVRLVQINSHFFFKERKFL